MGNKNEIRAYQENFIEKNLNNSNWMEKTPSIFKLPLTRIILFGTHQSGTYSISEIGDSISICQSVDVRHQLIAGARTLDLRPGKYDKKIVSGHGPHPGDKMSNILLQIKAFLEENSKEFIILQLQSAGKFLMSDHSLNKEENVRLMDEIISVLGNLIVSKQDMDQMKAKSFGEITLEKLNSFKKQILVLSTDSKLVLSKFQDWKEAMDNGFFWYGHFVKGDYANSDDPKRALEHNEKNLNTERNIHCFGGCFMQLTPQGISSVWNLHLKLFNHSGGKIFDWIRKSLDKINMISFDFCFSYPALVQLLTYQTPDVFKIGFTFEKQKKIITVSEEHSKVLIRNYDEKENKGIYRDYFKIVSLNSRTYIKHLEENLYLCVDNARNEFIFSSEIPEEPIKMLYSQDKLEIELKDVIIQYKSQKISALKREESSTELTSGQYSKLELLF